MLETMGVTPEEFLEYKGRPLVRKDNDIYYGDLSDNYHVFMMVMTDKPTSKGIDVPVIGAKMVRSFLLVSFFLMLNQPIVLSLFVISNLIIEVNYD